MLRQRRLFEMVSELDLRAKEGRARRLKLLIAGRDEMIPMPGLAAEYYEEARLCWYTGSFVASILMTQLSFEEALRSQYRVAKRVRGNLSSGKKVDDAGFADLLAEARNGGLLSEKEFTSLDKVRRLRNPYVHSKDEGGSGAQPSFFGQSLKFKAPALVGTSVEQEAERGIRTLVTLFPKLCKRFWGLS